MEQEWVHGLSVIQPEEVRRVGEFAYQRDAKYALVGLSDIDTALVSGISDIDTALVSDIDTGLVSDIDTALVSVDQ